MMFDHVTTCTCVALNNSLFIPDVIVPGIATAGENFNITCRLDGVIERLVQGVATLNILPNTILTVPTLSGTAIMVTRQFTPVRTSDAMNYTCAATVFDTPSGFVSIATGVGEVFVQSNAFNFHNHI